MKTFSLFLIALNLVVLGWLQLGAKPISPASTAKAPSFTQLSQRLVLLSEQDLARVDSALINLPSELPQPTAINANLDTSTSASFTAPTTLESTSAKESTSVNPNSLTSPPVEVVAIEVQEEAPLTFEPYCGIVEGLSGQEQAIQMLAAINDLGGEGIVEVREVPTAFVYWVYLSGFGSEAEAMNLLKELQSKKIDSFYMKSGDLAGGISLGVFSKEVSANTYSAEIQHKGYDSLVGKVPRTDERTFISVKFQDKALKESTDWAEIKAKFPATNQQEVACK